MFNFEIKLGMDKIIPLHSLILAIGSCSVSKRDKLESIFPKNEISSIQSVYGELFGDTVMNRSDLLKLAKEELHRRINHRLHLGLRVVIDGNFQNKEEREEIAAIGYEAGVSIIYLCFGNKNALLGDGVAETIDMAAVQPVAVQPYAIVSSDTLKKKYNGITVVGDIHGSIQALHGTIRWARSRNHYLLFCGDLVSYGPGGLEVVDEVYRLVCASEATLILGNHERKLLRWIDRQGRDIRLSDGNRVTTSAISSLSPTARRRWIGRFRGLVHQSEIIFRLDDFAFAHAAIHPDYWGGSCPRRYTHVYDTALFGEYDNHGSRFNLTYRWVDAIPDGQTVIVGHDIRSRISPLVVTNHRRGRAVFLDTGAGKGGCLSSADLRFSDDGFLRLECFNIH